jgi:hypothetical protein
MIEGQIIFQGKLAYWFSAVDLLELISRATPFSASHCYFAHFFANTVEFHPCASKFWFYLVERLARNHIDEWLLINPRVFIRRGSK